MMTLLFVALAVQDPPVAIPREKWPQKAECVACLSAGTDHGLEKPVAGFRYKERDFFFCNKDEASGFRKDPEAYLPPVLPRPMPDFSLRDLDGEAWTRDSFKDRLVLVDFWATWCEPCKRVKPVVESVKRQYAAKGFEVLSVSIDEKQADLAKFVAKTPFENPVLFDDSETWRAWNVRVVPTLFLVKNGEVIAQWSGIVPRAKLEKAVSQAVRD